MYQRDPETGNAIDSPMFAMKRQGKHLMLKDPKKAEVRARDRVLLDTLFGYI